ncbi:preprotein translocase subunit SecG [Pararhizobium antarcticum]|uniref:Protein-export membrane protein SecG n=1 Tax=Pararhizobium antarcticum TaxID=1798805 RepID=A0A657LP53_9HYPH|nr:preprotein translocase subunit SecG [Pararhizobium antarcticum]OJF91794.1 preprotein translocase subunit SecG [Rhizobium sp. 58]OJF93730.1 preprotein translocase subunit SecG [Pararhizobium antarcticum]
MQTILLVIYLMVVLALIGVVLIQRSEGGGLGIGGGSGFMSARGAANALTRTTAILATMFFVLALGMGILSRYEPNATDVLDRIPGTTNTGNGVLDSLGGTTTPPVDQNAVPNDSGAATTPATQTPVTQTPVTTQTQTPATTIQTPAGAATTGTQTTPATSGSDVPSGQ